MDAAQFRHGQGPIAVPDSQIAQWLGVEKPYGHRPFITSIAEAREYITEELEAREYARVRF